ncbi:UDP-glucose 6-dehydrogenase [gamma proteobacterium HTCC5015]|nr:UDP-glucose 6-dehydrogenase [gamma proteobacterium HTCC5015]
MRVTVFGSGYVGLVSGACFANAGNQVTCVDIDPQKIERLQQGDIPIYEPGLSELMAHNISAGRIDFTTDAAEAVRSADMIFIAVGTPPDEDGSADLRYVLAVAKTIGENLDGYKVIVDKSTVPVGTADQVKGVVAQTLAERGENIEFDVISNPEFLKEGAALDDFNKPDRVIIGADSERAIALARELYAPFNRNHDRLIVMDVRSAEMTKYAANAMLATKISFMNEMANIAERVGADIEAVRRGIGSDPRIGYHFIYAGAGYGGSCFPKDVNALHRTAQSAGVQSDMLAAVESTNQRQKQTIYTKLSAAMGGDLSGKTIAVWGLAFKPNTDDMREAPSRVLMESLWQAGARVQAYDPEAMQETRRIYGEREELTLCDDPYAALSGTDALVICTDWKSFTSPDFAEIKRALANPIIIDGRNLYDPQRMVELGFDYYGVGRGLSVRSVF